MKDRQLPDGTWVTSAISAQPTPQCPDDTCTWENFGPPMPHGILPIPLQLQRCSRCLWTRGLYLENPYPDALPPTTYSLDGRDVTEQDICIIAMPLELTNLTDKDVIVVAPCLRCSRPLYVDPESVQLTQKGARVSCPWCAVACRPDIIAGKDPDTGRPLTLAELLSHPNSVGAFFHRDLKPKS